MAYYNWRICPPSSVSTSFDIKTSIDLGHVDPFLSPIDLFIIKSRELNSHLIDPNNFKERLLESNNNGKLSSKAYRHLLTKINDTTLISPVLANLVLLGHISAVESYLREIFRRLVNVDETTQKACYQKTVTFGAVLVHDEESLPDALLELINFSGKRNVEENLREFYGFKGKFPNSIEPVLEEFNKICQLRHCIIHKFGVLGSNNVREDLKGFANYINKPIKANFSIIQEVSQICWNLVDEVNQMLWQNAMMHTIAKMEKNGAWAKRSSVEWKWKWNQDRKLFKKYFDIFFSINSAPGVVDMRPAYDDLKNTYLNL